MKDILLKEKIMKRVFSPIRNKEDTEFHSVFLFLHENSEILCEWKEVDGIWVRIMGETGCMVVVAETKRYPPLPICCFPS